jgi:hypothetical protein
VDFKPLTPDYVAGFIDGEGCFELGVVRNKAKRKYGWQIRIRFSLAQKGAMGTLTGLKEFFGCGTVRPRPSKSTLNMNVFTLESRREIVAITIPIFDTLPLRIKRRDYEIWRSAALLLGTEKHWHSPEVYLRYLELRDKINPGRGRRRKVDSEKLRQAIITRENS